jgi:hypothetical protein
VGTNGIIANTVPPVPSGLGTATFTLTAPPGALAGPATVTVTGTSGTATAALAVAVLLTDGFTLSSDPTTFFLGNITTLTLNVERNSFSGDVTIQPGTLPPGIVSVEPLSVLVPPGNISAQFQVTAVPQVSASGLAVSIPFTASAALSTSLLADSGGGAGLVAHSATGTLRAPFEAAQFVGFINLPLDSIFLPKAGCSNTMELGDSIDLCITVDFEDGFSGVATVSASTGSGGLQVTTPPVTLSQDGVATIGVTSSLPGTFTPAVNVRAGNFVVRPAATVVVTPPPYTLRISPSPTVQFNGTLPTVMRIEVAPQPGFTGTVRVAIPDGQEVTFDGGRCTSPQGFVSYTGSFGQPGILTLDIGPPYGPAIFCMAAALFSGIPQPGSEPIVVSSTSPGTRTQQSQLALRVGIPQITVTPVSSFNIDSGQTVFANVRVDSVSGYNLPVQLWITGPGSFCGDGTNRDPLPVEILSVDCGPSGPGRIVSPGRSVTCSLKNNTTSGTNSIELLAFALYPHPDNQNCVERAFRVCTTDGSSCETTILGDDPPVSRIAPPAAPASAQASLASQGRQWLEARSGDCAGFRVQTGSASFCGGSDLELTPSISPEGTIHVEALALNGGIIDLGPQPLSGAMDLPESGYGMRAAIEPGRIYAVKSATGYALFYAGGVRSEIDPRLAARRAGEGLTALGDSLDALSADGLTDTLLNRARVSIDLQWAASYGGRRIEYRFSASPTERVQPGIFRRRPASAP